MELNNGYIYSTAKRIINGKTYVGAAIGRNDELIKTERAAIKNLLEKITEINDNI